MQTHEAQSEVRTTYLGGFPGQFVSGLLWIAAAAVSTFVAPERGIALLAIGGIFIFPLSQLVLRAMGRPATLRDENPLKFLAMQIAFTIPLVMPLAFAVKREWFFPAMMLIVGAHYLPFIFLYGMRMFAVLAAVLCGAAMVLVMTNAAFTTGAWLTGIVLLAFSAIGLISSGARASLPRSA